MRKPLNIANRLIVGIDFERPRDWRDGAYNLAEWQQWDRAQRKRLGFFSGLKVWSKTNTERSRVLISRHWPHRLCWDWSIWVGMHRGAHWDGPLKVAFIVSRNSVPLLTERAMLFEKEPFLNKYAFPEPMSGCWLWLGALTNRGGYGRFNISGTRRAQAHRVSWEVHNGRPIPDGMDILHKCDNPSCVNPDHLYPGDDDQNARDMVRRNRTMKWAGRRRGEANPRAKLRRDNVPEIIEMVRSGRTIADVAASFGVSRTTISDVVRGRRWAA